jgi:hypothetical protein
MTSQLEFNSRAALCREFARREPKSRGLWMAEAESWSRYWLCFKFKATAKHSPSRQAAGIVRKDPFEEFLDLMAIEDGR